MEIHSSRVGVVLSSTTIITFLLGLNKYINQESRVGIASSRRVAGDWRLLHSSRVGVVLSSTPTIIIS